MILAVSPNLALDRVHVVRGYRAGQQCRAVRSFLQPGGSGVHAASVIQSLGGQAVAMGLLGGHAGDLWRAEAEARRLTADLVDIPGETRESFCLIDLDLGNVVESVEAGPHVHPEALSALLARLDQYLTQAEMLIVSGSLPPGFPGEGYVEMAKLARRHHVPVLADLHGEQLRQILAAGPWLIKPSLSEFDALVGHETRDLAERERLSQELHRDSGAIVALSMSGDGLLVTGPQGQWVLLPPAVDVHLPGGRGRNVIGCGDALVGALAHEYCQTGDLLSAARMGMAAAHCTLGTFGVPEIDAERVRSLAPAVGLEIRN
ncbi:MAG TPA: PfkB family carbohydrate kinase [Anaerolineales bacterium]|nr:PfkB family carbohydrate kinase [Anaerolineales bacterium]